ncbi:MAG: hypothetical protein Q9208_005014 [Pyrenodesmia sp. 3 TL-2023]
MANRAQQPHSDTLAPPRKSVELEDPGAHELSSGDEEEVFSDAQEDPKASSRTNSPIPTTRVEKVDDRDSHGDVPGTEAYNMRKQDAVPDELEIVGDVSSPSPRRVSQSQPDRTSTPGGTPIPKTVVEKIDSTSPSHGEVPRTAAHHMRQADAVPDVILQSPKAKIAFGVSPPMGPRSPEIPVPKTVVTKVDEQPSHGEVPGTEAYNMRTEDATPDVVETKGDPFGLPTKPTHRSSLSSAKPRPSAVRHDSQIAADGGFGRMPDDEDAGYAPGSSDPQEESQFDRGASDDGFGDDFDDFEAGAEAEEFGDFDDGLGQPEPPKPEPFPFSKAVYLIAPPPLTPPNWLRSRTRRLFLVSLGVPIDLDEILPKSKQKKLVLPSTVRSDSEHRRSESRRRKGGEMKGAKDANISTTSLSSHTKDARDRDRKKRKAGNDHLPSHPPPLDSAAVRSLSATTETALKNMTDSEIEMHVRKLEELTQKAGKVLEYWVGRRDAAMGEKEMFESVVGDLVKHARRVRR